LFIHQNSRTGSIAFGQQVYLQISSAEQVLSGYSLPL